MRRDERDGTAGATLTDAYARFERLRRRHLRLTRAIRRKQAEAEELSRRSRGRLTMAVARDRVGYHPAWSEWSKSSDEVASAADRLLRSRPRSLAELVLIFYALEWLLLTDGVIVDRGAERQVRAVGRHLRRLAAGEPEPW